LSRVINSHWVDERIRAQRVAARRASLAPVRDISLDILGSRAEVRRRGGIIPSWVIFGMILVASVAVCFTVNMRNSAKLNLASDQYARVQTYVESLRSGNEALRLEVERLRSDPRTIELAARSRLNMVRSNEIVVPIE
jgi:cell division protein FtsB